MLKIVSLILISTIAFTGIFGLRQVVTISPNIHPYLTLILGPALIFVEWLLARQDEKNASTSYLIIFGVVTAYLIGFGTMMNLFPLFFHQIVVWPLVIFSLTQGLRRLF